jgi:hypothetical protein
MEMTKEDPFAQLKTDFYSIKELSPLSTPSSSPPGSPRNSRSPSPGKTFSRAQSPAVSRSPIRPDSPLLCPHTLSPSLKRARSFNKDLRRAASFRAARERVSLSRNNSPACSRFKRRLGSDIIISFHRNTSPVRMEKQEISFRIKKALGMRKG